MERLTERDGNIVYYPHCNNAGKCGGHCSICDFEVKIMNKLAEYEDAEEQGLLLKLSYKVGDVVYYSKEYLTDREAQPYEITNLMISCNKKGEWTKKYSAMRLVDSKTIDDRLDFAFEEIGKTVFLTKEEAEQALAGMKEV